MPSTPSGVRAHAGTRFAGRGSARRARPTNSQIAASLVEIADLLALQDANPFRIRAYRNAARLVEMCGRDLTGLVEAGMPLPAIPGIGADLARKIRHLAREGDCELLRDLRQQVPSSLRQLLELPGLGPRRVQCLRNELGVESPADLLQAARKGRVRRLSGFGVNLERRLLTAVEGSLNASHRLLLPDATAQADHLCAELRRVRGVTAAVSAGSVRRMRDTVGDIDLLAAAEPGTDVTTSFVDFPEIAEVIAQGGTRVTAILTGGVQVDLRVVEPSQWGAALVYFTGSQAHTLAIRRRARQRGLKVNEYGVYRGARRIAGDTEASVYRALELDPIAPELREDRGEIEAAAAHALPRLIEQADVRGDLHAHSRATDGRDTLDAMARAARTAGLEYMAITDHSRRLTVAHGLDAEQLLRQGEHIDRLNETLDGLTLLKGVEVEILADGSLDLPDDVLRRLDLVVIAVHSHFDLPRDRQTVRLLRALDHPCVSVLAHPGARLIQQRPPLDIDLSTIVRAARARGCFLELNSQPRRMDLWDVMCREARDAGVLVSVASDAHATAEFGFLRRGIGQARRGWLRAEDVLNSRPLPALRKLLSATFRR